MIFPIVAAPPNTIAGLFPGDVSALREPAEIVKSPTFTIFAKISSINNSSAVIFRAIRRSVATLEKFAPNDVQYPLFRLSLGTRPEKVGSSSFVLAI